MPFLAMIVFPAIVYAQASAIRPSVASTSVTVFIDVAVVSMDTERVLPAQAVLVQDGRIAALGPSGRIAVPTGAMRIDGRGKYLMPGLADMHAHFLLADSTKIERELFRGLAQGITTIRVVDAHRIMGYTKLLLSFKERAAAGQLWSPRIYASGPWGPPQYTNLVKHTAYARAYGVSQDTTAPRLDSVAAYVAAYKAAGYDHVKVYFEEDLVFDSLVVAARRIGLPLVGHVRKNTFPAGYKSIEHGYGQQAMLIETGAISPDSIRKFATAIQRAGIWTCPTLVLFSALGTNLKGYRQLTKALQDAGAGLLLGTDKGGVGPVIEELTALVGAGLTPYQALLAGTRNVAQYFGTLDSAGTVAVGKRADLVLLSDNPLADVRHTREPAGVMVGGRWLDRVEIGRRLDSMKVLGASSP